MASSSGVQSFQQPFQCKECGLALNSAESLEVHLQYHQENLMQQWAVKAQSSGEEKNNNMTKAATGIKREFSSSNSVAADSSDMQKKSPDYHRSTPEGIYGHPPTPQSYQSASSPYQNHENSAFSPNFQNFPLGKSEGSSPSTQQQSHYQSSFANFAEQQQQFFGMEPNSPYSQDLNTINKHSINNSFRYHPYGAQSFERPKSQGTAPPASPAYPPQPTPSPSPKQCDKCGYVCESAAQLIEHNNLTHSNNPQVQSQYPQNNQHFMFDQQTPIKEEDASQSEILDLDSHKVVHPVWAEVKEEDKRPNGESSNPHSVSAMLGTWPPTPQQQQASMFQGEHNMFINESGDPKMFSNIQENKMFPADQKLFQPHQIGNQNFINNGVSSSNPEMGATNQQSYRSFEHLPTPPSSVITSTQVPQVPTANAGPTGSVKGANWKSNEARRPKTYQCTACNKWFTSSGHLKRHYNTTLHKNAVKSSGQPDPATLPISAHHHPSRDNNSNKEDSRTNSNSPRDDGKGDDSNGMGAQFDNRLGVMPGLLQHPPNGPYDRQTMHHTPPMHSPLAQHHTPLGNPSPLGGHMMSNSGYPNMPNGSPPNGDAGLSPPDSRGLLSMAPPPHSFNMMSQPPMIPPMEATQFQMYPNGLAPHVSQATDTTSNHNTTGELQFVVQNDVQPLPSFAQIQAHRFGMGLANVGGLELVTAPASFTYYTSEHFDLNETTRNMLLKEDDGSPYKLAVITNQEEAMQQSPEGVNHLPQYSPTSSNNNNNEIKAEMNYDTYSENLEEADLTYLTPGSSQPLGQPLEITTDPLGESKENYEENTATGSPRITSTTVPHQDESKTKCFDCDKVFNRPCYLTQHNKTCHNGDKPFKCTRCGKRFSDEQTYKDHTRKHAGDKPHKCDMCPKMFNHKTDLRRHLCCHTGRKPYACEVCGKGFIRKDHMVKHMDTHTRKKEKLIGAMRS